MAFGEMTWELCRRSDQSVLATLDDRLPGAKVDIQRQQARSAAVVLDANDPAVPLVEDGSTLLRCTVSGWREPAFVGRVTQKQVAFDDDLEALAIAAVDPWAQLQRAVILISGLFSGGILSYKTFSNTQKASVMIQLMQLATTHGIAAGSQPASSLISPSFSAGTVIADAILSIVSQDDSPEFELTPSLASDGTLVTMNTYYPRQGSDKSATAVLKIGVDDTDNCSDLSYTESLDGMSNRHTVIGDVSGTHNEFGLDWPTHLAYRADHAASQAANGLWETVEQLSGTTDPGTIQRAALAVVAANALPLGSFGVLLDPDTGLDFSPNGDIWMGDTVGLEAGLPKETLSAGGRIASVTLVEDENRDVDVALACEPDASAGVTSTALTVIADAGDGQVPPPPPDAGSAASDDPCASSVTSFQDVLGGDPCAKASKKKKKKKK